MRLISMVDYVLEQDLSAPIGRTLREMIKYGLFIKQPLELWMFVPCDEDGNILEFPSILDHKYSVIDVNNFEKELQEYYQAKERCLFDGCITFLKQKDYYIIYLNESAIYLSWNKSKIIENIISFDIELTQTAIKQIS